MWPNRARIQDERIVHQITLSDQFAIGFGGMAVQKTLVNRVVHHLDALVRNGQQLFDFVLGELGHRDHPRRLSQHAPRQIKVQAASQTGTVASDPVRKYWVSRSRRASVRTTCRMGRPTPNSVMRRMSMAILTA